MVQHIQPLLWDLKNHDIQNHKSVYRSEPCEEIGEGMAKKAFSDERNQIIKSWIEDECDLMMKKTEVSLLNEMQINLF